MMMMLGSVVHDVKSTLDGIANLGGRQSSINGTRNVWIIKPAKLSRSRGIQVVRSLREIFRLTEEDSSQWVCQKYIERPQVVRGFKFDIRQWVLVTNWSPLTVYIWSQPYFRFAGQRYDENITTTCESVHLTSACTAKTGAGGDEEDEENRENGYMWFLQQYEDWLHQECCGRQHHCTPWLHSPPYTCDSMGISWEDYDQQRETSATTAVTSSDDTGNRVATTFESTTPEVERATPDAPKCDPPPPDCASDCEHCENRWVAHLRPQIEQIIISSLVCVTDCIKQRKNSIELFGYDFMIAHGAEDLNVWLLEVNRSPSVGYASRVKAPLVRKMMEDTAKVLVDLPMDPTASTGDWELIRHENCRSLPGKPCQNVQLAVHGEKLTLPRPRGKKSKAS